jgi:hypothetical protein
VSAGFRSRHRFLKCGLELIGLPGGVACRCVKLLSNDLKFLF